MPVRPHLHLPPRDAGPYAKQSGHPWSPAAISLDPPVTTLVLLLVALLVLNLGAQVPIPALRALVVLPVALLAPGAAACFALFGPSMPTRRLMRVSLWIMVSMALYPLLALYLQMGGHPLTAGNTLRAVDSLILLLLAAGFLRATANGRTAHFQQGSPLQVRSTGGVTDFGHRMRGPLLAAILMLGLVPTVACALTTLPGPPPAPYTQVALAGRWSHLHTVAYSASGRFRVSIRITNRTGHRGTYRVAPTVDADESWAGVAVALGSGASWTGAVRGAVPMDGRLHRLRVAVFEAGTRQPRATLTLWLQRMAPHDRTSTPDAARSAMGIRPASSHTRSAVARTGPRASSDDQPPTFGPHTEGTR
jgi:hypothetical protein